METVQDYVQAYTDDADMPPLTVYLIDGKYYVVDGFHRLEAVTLGGFDAVPCEVMEGTFEEAEWAAIGANRTHGLRRTTKDKQNAVKRALGNPQAKLKTARELADHCGVSHTTIERWQTKLWHIVPNEPQDEGDAEDEQPEPDEDDTPAYDKPDTPAAA